jgi:endoglucanase
MTRNDRARLLRLLALPTAPFREEQITRWAENELRRGKVPFFRDPAGNLVIGCASPTEYRRRVREQNREPLRLLIAHMDHPGFHGRRWLSPTRLEVRWLGGAPTRRLAGSRVWLAGDDGAAAAGRLSAARLDRHGRLVGATVRLNDGWPGRHPAASSLYGGLAFRAPVWVRGRRLYTKAADDLVGVFAVVHTARQLFRRKRRQSPPFIGLLTRAEEVGFIGAIAHFELGWLDGARRPVLAVSLETSRTLPGARIGKGPVVRLGDRRTVFDPDALQVLNDLSRRTLGRCHQRRIMDGGACEASAALAWGIAAIGLSVPLGNYHNTGLEGGPDCRGAQAPAPEFVHLDDVGGLLKLCRALVRPGLPWNEPWKRQRRRFQRNLRRYRRLLRPAPGRSPQETFGGTAKE